MLTDHSTQKTVRAGSAALSSMTLAAVAALLLAGCPAGSKGQKGPEAPPAGGDATEQTGAATSGQEGSMAEATGGAQSGATSEVADKDAIKGQRELAAVSTLVLKLDSADVTIVPVAEGVAPSAVWTISKAKGPNPAPQDSLSLTIDEQGGKVTVSDKYHGAVTSIKPQLKLTLSLPAACALEASVGNGALSIDSSGTLKADMGNGSLLLRGKPASTDITVGNGSVEGQLMLLLGQHHINLGNGGVKLKLEGSSQVSYSATTSIGQINLGSLSGSVNKNMMSQQASGTLGAGTAQLIIQVGNGGITLNS